MGFLTVLLTILKIIGIVLASVIGFIILLVLIILLSPVSYKGRIKYDGRIDINIRARYLFGLVRAYFIKNEKEQVIDLKLLRFSLLKPKTKKKRRKAGKHAPAESPARETFDYEARQTNEDAKRREPSAKEIKADAFDGRGNGEKTAITSKQSAEYAKDKDGKTPKEKKSIFKRVKDIYNKIADMLKSFTDMREKIFKEINDEGNKRAVSFTLGIIKKLLKHILPRKHRIYVKFGTGDPAATGEILGAAYAFGALLGLNLCIEPDFENKVIECDIPFKGHVSFIRVLIWALKVYLNKDVKGIIQKING